MPAHPKPPPRAKKPGAMKTKPKSVKAAITAASDVLTEDRAKAPKPAKAPKAAATPKKAASAKPAVPAGTSKTDLIIAMLKKPGGASSKELETATGWQPHSVRGLLGTLRKKGVIINAQKFAKGEPTVYSIQADVPEPVEDVI